VRRVTQSDRLDDIVAIHAQAFPGFFMTQLGGRFLRAYYGCVVDSPHGLLIAEDGSRGCVGFVAGFVDPAAFYQELRRRRVRLGLAACAGIVCRPWRLAALLANYRRAGGLARRGPDARTAELSSLAVTPHEGGRGVGSRLVHAFVEAAGAQGAHRILLTTDAYGNEVVNRFYQRLGFTCVRCFEARPGRWLNEYALVVRGD
jgi:ribosomal protein S18 acetylase RimI-like enzyme